jgi:hypothetical protein
MNPIQTEARERAEQLTYTIKASFNPHDSQALHHPLHTVETSIGPHIIRSSSHDASEAHREAVRLATEHFATLIEQERKPKRYKLQAPIGSARAIYDTERGEYVATLGLNLPDAYDRAQALCDELNGECEPVKFSNNGDDVFTMTFAITPTEDAQCAIIEAVNDILDGHAKAKARKAAMKAELDRFFSAFSEIVEATQ